MVLSHKDVYFLILWQACLSTKFYGCYGKEWAWTERYVTRTCTWHHGEGRLHRVDKHAHDIRLFRTVQHCDQLQVEFFEALQLHVLLAAPHQTGSRKIQSARASHAAVRRSYLIRDLLKNVMHIRIWLMWLIMWAHSARSRGTFRFLPVPGWTIFPPLQRTHLMMYHVRWNSSQSNTKKCSQSKYV
jgi:hypothetical protein